MSPEGTAGVADASPDRALIERTIESIPEPDGAAADAASAMGFALAYLRKDDADNALTNFEWVGYQPPQTYITPDYLIENEYAAEFLRPALVTPEDFDLSTAWVQGPLDAETEALWSDQWTRANSGG